MREWAGVAVGGGNDLFTSLYSRRAGHRWHACMFDNIGDCKRPYSSYVWCWHITLADPAQGRAKVIPPLGDRKNKKPRVPSPEQVKGVARPPWGTKKVGEKRRVRVIPPLKQGVPFGTTMSHYCVARYRLLVPLSILHVCRRRTTVK
eukprot:scaffold308753_cov54-Prasinocladus_malaysianus.AAC.2